jgi:TolB protein
MFECDGYLAMLLRTYRLTDKLGNAVVKLCATAAQLTAERFADALSWTGRGVGALFAFLWLVVRRIFGAIWWVIGGIFGVLGDLLGLIFSRKPRTASQTTTVLNATGKGASLSAVPEMTRRAAQSEIKATLREDPLLVNNRILSRVVVGMLAVLLLVIVWATNPARNTQLGLVALVNNPSINNSENPPVAGITLPTVVPTATELPSVLEPRGSIAYVARENGQSDIWVFNVGSRTPLRLTNDPADDRDPAWSPNGRQLAFASRRDGNWDLYIYDIATSNITRLTFGAEFQGAPTWSPDGNAIAYESYQGDNLDIYIVPVDGSSAPLRLTDNAASDFWPSWSQDGRRMAFVSWRDGNQEIYSISLDDPRDETAVNLTNTPTRNEEYPRWAPTLERQNLIAYSALDEGVEKIFVLDAATQTSQVLERGRAPSWSPDGVSIVYALDSVGTTQLVATPYVGTGVAASIIPVLNGATTPTWSPLPLPASLISSGGLGPASSEQLYIEQEERQANDPFYRLNSLPGVEAPVPNLSDRVNDSFNALRQRTLSVVGWDFLGELDDAFWRIDRPVQPGEERRNWHMTGRGFSFRRSSILGFPAPVEVVREDIGVNTYWRVYVRVDERAQSGLLGEPLRHMPWNFAARDGGDVSAYNEGGRLRSDMPNGYYVDFTLLASDYDWEWIPSGSDWRANVNSINYWMFIKPDGLNWVEAMRELYSEGGMGGFYPTPTPQAAIATSQGG